MRHKPTSTPTGPCGQPAPSPLPLRGQDRVGGGSALLRGAGGAGAVDGRGFLAAQATEAQETKRPK